MVASGKNQVPVPIEGERYVGYVTRAHAALRRSIPDPDERNQAVWDAWEQKYGNSLRDRALQKFDQNEYRFVPNVCHFVEHEINAPDGKTIKYGVNELSQICDTINQRADRGSYSAITEDHTPNDKNKDEEPEVIGYSSSCRLGQVGTENPSWAIFGDEHQSADELDKFAKRRRRSVEMLRFRDGRHPYYDPIATLGADSPRLAMPIARYEATTDYVDGSSDPVVVDRYSVACSSMGQSNSYVPTDKYELPGNPQSNQGDSDMNGMDAMPNELVAQIVAAIRSTPEMQWVSEQMNMGSAQPGGAAPNQGPSASGGQPGASPYSNFPAANRPTSYSAGGNFNSDEGDDVDKMQYDALRSDNEALSARVSDLTEKYSQSQAQNQELVAHSKHLVEEIGKSKDRIAALEKTAVDAHRSERIRTLYSQYEHFVDVEEESKACLYSQGSTMTDEDFNRHIAQVEKYAIASPGRAASTHA